MIFSERRKLVEKYYKWLDDDAKDCPLNVVTFLDSIGKLKDTEDQMEPETIKGKKGTLYHLDGEIVGEVTFADDMKLSITPVTLNDSVTALNNALQFDAEPFLEGLKTLAKHMQKLDNRRRYSRMFYRVEPKRFRPGDVG